MTDGTADLTSLARGGLINAAGAATNAVLGFMFVAFISHRLGADGTGLFFAVVAVFTIATLLAQLGTDVGVVRMVPRWLATGRFDDVRRGLVIATVPVALAATALAALLVVLAPSIAALLADGEEGITAATVIRVLAVSLPAAAVCRVVLSATRGLGTMVPFVAVENVGKPALRLALAVASLAAGFGPVALALAWAVPGVVGFVIALAAFAVVWQRAVPLEPQSRRRTPVRALAREFWGFTAFRGVAAVFQVAVLWLDIFLVGALDSTEAAGHYTAASRFVFVGALALQSVVLVIGPQMSDLLARRERSRARSLYQTATLWITAASGPLCFALAVFSPFFLAAFGSDFAPGASALTILALAMLVNIATGPVTVVLLMAGKSSWNVANTLGALVVNVVLNVLLIPPLGIVGAAIACAASILVANLVPLVQVRVLLGLQPFGPGFGRVAAAAFVCFGALGLAVRDVAGVSPTSFTVYAVTASVAYLVVLRRSSSELRLDLLRDAVRPRGGGAFRPGSLPGASREPLSTPRPTIAQTLQATGGPGTGVGP